MPSPLVLVLDPFIKMQIIQNINYISLKSGDEL